MKIRGKSRRRRARQTTFTFRTWGGKRKGAGRKPRGARAGVRHRPRCAFTRRSPVHVTLRMARHVYNLRSRRSFRVIEKALWASLGRFDTQVVQFAVLGNHVHLLVESDGHVSLGRAMKGLAVRLARGLNRLMGKRGRVLDDRYHGHVLRTPTEVKHARAYIAGNYAKHAAERGEKLRADFVDPYSSAPLAGGAATHAPELGAKLPPPTSWLLTRGLHRVPP